MRAILNQTIQLTGFAKPVPQGAVITVVDEAEANQLFARGYMSKTTKEATHDHLSMAAEAEAAAEATAQAEARKKVISEADAEAKATAPKVESPEATTKSPKKA